MEHATSLKKCCEDSQSPMASPNAYVQSQPVLAGPIPFRDVSATSNTPSVGQPLLNYVPHELLARSTKSSSELHSDGGSACENSGSEREYPGVHELNIIAVGIPRLPEPYLTDILELILGEKVVAESMVGHIWVGLELVSTQELWEIYRLVLKFSPESVEEAQAEYDDKADEPCTPFATPLAQPPLVLRLASNSQEKKQDSMIEQQSQLKRPAQLADAHAFGSQEWNHSKAEDTNNLLFGISQPFLPALITSLTGTTPPTLPPSTEEAYRRKCIQLKKRLIEIEASNDEKRLSLARSRRGVEKLRLERAYLLEQLAKRTSTNVDDSEGSPSPPSTPKEKPLRTKRGHRKPSFLANLDQAPSFVSGTGGAATLSPSGSDAFSHPDAIAPIARTANINRQHASLGNGYQSAVTYDAQPRVPKSAFDIYCRDMKDALISRNFKAFNEGTFDPDHALAEGWQKMGADQRGEYQRSFEALKTKAEEDTEMGDAGDDTEIEGVGFTPVNRG